METLQLAISRTRPVEEVAVGSRLDVSFSEDSTGDLINLFTSVPTYFWQVFCLFIQILTQDLNAPQLSVKG